MVRVDWLFFILYIGVVVEMNRFKVVKGFFSDFKIFYCRFCLFNISY